MGHRLWVALAAMMVLAAATPALADIPPGAVREQQAIPGLEKPAQILIDQWGVPHIYAASERDAFFLQGWNAARDRLWQIDLWRKRGLGRLSASFGPAYVAQDKAARLFLYRGDMAAEWAAYGPSARTRAEAFAAGVNAYVAAVLKGDAPLPVEFTLTNSRPELWDASDIVRIRSHALTRNADSEVARARVTCLAGLGLSGRTPISCSQAGPGPTSPDCRTPRRCGPRRRGQGFRPAIRWCWAWRKVRRWSAFRAIRCPPP